MRNRTAYRIVKAMSIWVAPAMIILLSSTTAFGITTSALKDLTCAGFRQGSALGCTAGEFTVGATFSATPDTPPFCVAGQSFNFKVELRLYGSNANRYDIGFFAGQQGNDPSLATPGNICSVATFPETPSPWLDLDAGTQPTDTCGDYLGAGDSTNTVDEIKVLCEGDSTGALKVPYVLTYWQNSGNVCTGPSDVAPGSTSKCNKGTSTVSGTVKVYSGAYVDVSKQTSPSGDAQSFTLTATGPVGSKVIALTGATLVNPTPIGGTYTPATIDAATNTVNVTISHGETVRFYINALATSQTLTITESATTFWEPMAASISCSPVTGSPALTTDNGTRTITAGLDTANSAAACTITNKKRSRITMVKNVDGRVNASDQFSVTADGGGTLTDSAGTPITAPVSITTGGVETTKQTTFWSQPGQTLTITDAAASGSLADYHTIYSCTNALVGSPTVMPSGTAGSFTLTPGDGDDITCTYTNRVKPRISKAFSPVSIGTNDPSVMTVTLTNLNTATDITGISFTDTYPPGLVNTSSPSGSTTCGGTPSVTAVAGSGSVALSGATIPANGSCTVTVNVTSGTAGSYTNTIAAGGVGSANAGSNPGSASATLNILNHPTVAKSFAPSELPVNSASVLTITLSNSNGVDITGAAFTDAYPADMVNTGTPNGSTTCAGGTVTAAAGGVTVALSGGTIPANGSCTVTVNVTSAIQGTYNNSTGTVSTANAGNGNSASATVKFFYPPTTAKAFSPPSIGTSDTSVLTITLTNPNGNDITGAAFTDAYPADMVNTGTPNGSTTCAGGTVTAAAGGVTVALSGGTIPANGSCTVTVNVTSATPGSYNNSTGTISTAQAGNGAAASAVLTVLDHITAAKTFSPSTITANAPSVLTITLTNPNAVAVTGAAFTDIYPANLINTGTPTGATTCAGGSVTAAALGGSVSLSGGTIPAGGNCALTVNVTSTIGGSYLNSTGSITTANAGSATAASDTLTVLAPSLTVLKTVQAYSDPINGQSSPKAIPGSFMTYTITVINSGTGAADDNTTVITDQMPANTELFVGDIIGAGSGPVRFINGSSCSAGTADSGLSYTFTGLNDGTDNLQFSKDNGTSWNPTVTADGNGCDASVTNISISLSGPFNGTAASGGSNTSFCLQFRVRVK